MTSSAMTPRAMTSPALTSGALTSRVPPLQPSGAADDDPLRGAEERRRPSRCALHAHRRVDDQHGRDGPLPGGRHHLHRAVERRHADGKPDHHCLVGAGAATRSLVRLHETDSRGRFHEALRLTGAYNKCMALVRKSSFSKAQGLRETGLRGPLH